MKKRKVVALLLALVMVLGLCPSAWASPGSSLTIGGSSDPTYFGGIDLSGSTLTPGTTYTPGSGSISGLTGSSSLTPPSSGITAITSPGTVSYYTYSNDGSSRDEVTKSSTAYTVINDTSITSGEFDFWQSDGGKYDIVLGDGVYVVNSDTAGTTLSGSVTLTGSATQYMGSIDSHNTLSADTYTLSGKLKIIGNATLVLCDGATLTVSGIESANNKDGIYNNYYGSLTVCGQSEGENAGKLIVTHNVTSATDSSGLTAQNLTLHGGNVEVTSTSTSTSTGTGTGTGTGTSTYLNHHYAVRVSEYGGALTVYGGSLTAKAVNSVNSIWSYGISTAHMYVYGGEVNATGGDTNDYSYGIYMKCLEKTAGTDEDVTKNSDFKVTGGKVNAIGGTVTLSTTDSHGESCGIMLKNGKGDFTVSGSAIVTAKGGKITRSGDNTVYDAKSLGIYAPEFAVTVNGGTVEATGGDTSGVEITVDEEDNTYGSESYGFYAMDVKLKNSGNITATGSKASLYSCGLYVQAFPTSYDDGWPSTADGGTVDVIGGTLTATGNEARYSYGLFAQHYGVPTAVTSTPPTYNVTVSNRGSITATGGKATETSYGFRISLGVRASGSGTKIEATGREVNYTTGDSAPTLRSAGIYMDGNLIINQNIVYQHFDVLDGAAVTAKSGEITATALNNAGYSYGVWMDWGKEFNVDEDSTLTATGGNVTNTGGVTNSFECSSALSYGIFCAAARPEANDWMPIEYFPVILDGTVTATGGSASSKSGKAYSYGIAFYDGILTINGTVNATAKAATSEANSEAAGSEIEALSVGVYATKSISVTSQHNGTLTATGSSATAAAGSAESYGLHSTSGPIATSDNVVAKSGAAETSGGYYTEDDEAGNTTYHYSRAQSIAIYSEGDEVNISDGRVRATADSATGGADVAEKPIISAGIYGAKGVSISEDGEDSAVSVTAESDMVMGSAADAALYSAGIFGSEGDVDITGGTVNATGGTAMLTSTSGTATSAGIYSDKDVTVSGGTVVATGENTMGVMVTYSTGGARMLRSVGRVQAENYGICGQRVTVSGGDVKATGGRIRVTGGTGGRAIGAGIYGSSATTISGGTVEATGGGITFANVTGGTAYGVAIYGKRTTISGGNVKAFGGALTVGEGNEAYCVGIYSADSEDALLSITGGTVKTYTSAPAYGYGIYATKMSLTGGTVQKIDTTYPLTAHIGTLTHSGGTMALEGGSIERIILENGQNLMNLRADGYGVYYPGRGNYHIGAKFIPLNSTDVTQTGLMIRPCTVHVYRGGHCIYCYLEGSGNALYHPGNTTTDTVQSATTGDAGVLAYAVTALLSYTGTALAVRGRKRK